MWNIAAAFNVRANSGFPHPRADEICEYDIYSMLANRPGIWNAVGSMSAFIVAGDKATTAVVGQSVDVVYRERQTDRAF